MDQQSPPASEHSPSVFSLNERDKLTLKWSAVWSAVASGIEGITGFASTYFMGGVSGKMDELAKALGVSVEKTFPLAIMLTNVFWAAVSGAIGGIILSRFYDVFQAWNRKYLGNRLNTLFKLLFYPTLVGALFGIFVGGLFSYLTGFMPFIISLGGVVLGRYVYARMMVSKVGFLYEAQGAHMPPPQTPQPPKQS